MRWVLIIVGALVLLVGIVAVTGALLPKGHLVARSGRFHQPPQAIWRALTNIQDFPSWRKDVRAVHLLPDSAGHPVWQEVMKGMTITMEEEQAVPEQRLVARIADVHLPFGGRWIYDLHPEGEWTMVTITEQGEVYNPIFRFMSRFVFGQTATMDHYLRFLGGKFGETVEPVTAEPAS